jgi:hypothetical protein
MADGAVYCVRLESGCCPKAPGYESPPIRHLRRPPEKEAITKAIASGNLTDGLYL